MKQRGSGTDIELVLNKREKRGKYETKRQIPAD